jgi:hypothetical protein
LSEPLIIADLMISLIFFNLCHLLIFLIRDSDVVDSNHITPKNQGSVFYSLDIYGFGGVFVFPAPPCPLKRSFKWL